ncbi:sensor histidine kinase [Actinoplanes sp. TFC3]|uniref:sensor histidine kinase n=1 Tax=Actinoplanes sp. TFC3 TaxID=1710355 RepID=UPI00082FA915|nr:sensor histidine kinase [Actinoplanes sp. TFC3]
MQTTLLSRRYLLTSGPWRSLVYLVTTLPIAAPVSIAAGLLVLPYVATADHLQDGLPPTGALLFLMLVALILFAGFGPLIAVPLGIVERARLALIDHRPVPSPHPPAPRDPITWLRARYAETATWRELAYLLFLATIIPAAYAIIALLVMLDVAFLLSPLYATSTAGLTLGTYTVHNPGQAVPFVLLGLMLAPALGYVIGALATAQGAVARALLADPSGLALREVSQSRARLADAFDLERRRIERDLHDGAQHRLTSLTLHLGMAKLDTPPDSPAAEPLSKAHDQAKDLMVVLRDLIYGIRPQELTDLGLPAALRELAGRSPLPVSVTIADGVSRPSEQTEATAYFAASEALANVVKHANATRADIFLAQAGPTLILEVRDDGQGGATPAPASSTGSFSGTGSPLTTGTPSGSGAAALTAGTGLTGLADRISATNGRLLLSSPPGGPTLLRIELP